MTGLQHIQTTVPFSASSPTMLTGRNAFVPVAFSSNTSSNTSHGIGDRVSFGRISPAQAKGGFATIANLAMTVAPWLLFPVVGWWALPLAGVGSAIFGVAQNKMNQHLGTPHNGTLKDVRGFSQGVSKTLTRWIDNIVPFEPLRNFLKDKVIGTVDAQSKHYIDEVQRRQELGKDAQKTWKTFWTDIKKTKGTSNKLGVFFSKGFSFAKNAVVNRARSFLSLKSLSMAPMAMLSLLVKFRFKTLFLGVLATAGLKLFNLFSPKSESAQQTGPREASARKAPGRRVKTKNT